MVLNNFTIMISSYCVSLLLNAQFPFTKIHTVLRKESDCNNWDNYKGKNVRVDWSMKKFEKFINKKNKRQSELNMTDCDRID